MSNTTAVAVASADDTAMSTTSGGGGYTCAVGAWPGGGTGLPNSTYIASALAWLHSPETDALQFAFMSKVDSAHAADWACRAHDFYLFAMKDILVQLPGENPATCDCLGSTLLLMGNRGSVWGVGAGLTYDWVQPTFSSTEKSTLIIPALTSFEKQINNGGVVSTATPTPVGVQNNPSLIQQAATNAYGYMRSIDNNYGLFQGSALISMGLALDAADDPNTAHCAGGFDVVCPDGTPNSVRAGFHQGLGAWTYLQYLNTEEPTVSTAALNTALGSTLSVADQCPSNGFGNPTPLTATMPCYGNARGGASHEGSLYTGWLFHWANVGLLLQSSGNNDPTNYPQVAFYTSSWVDQTIEAYKHMTTPAIYSPAQSYQVLFGYGPENANYDQLNFISNYAMSVMDLDKRTGATWRNPDTGWLSGNMNIENSQATNIAGNAPAAINLFLAQLPGATPFSGFSDPRPTMPSSYYSYNAGLLYTSTGNWNATTGAVFRRYTPRFPQPNHEEGYAASFDLYRNGDWATKPIYSYAFNDDYRTGETPDAGNMAAYANTFSTQLPNPTLQSYIDPYADRGGAYSNGWPTGQTINDQWADTPIYTADHVDTTGMRNLYGPGAGIGIVEAQDITGATDDFGWVKPLYLWHYSRGDTGTAAFKRVWTLATGTPTVVGTDISWPSSLNKTSNYLHVLLQPSANITTIPIYPFANAVAFHDYVFSTGKEIEIDAATINSTTQVFTANNCVSGAAMCPTHADAFLADGGVTGGVSCGSLIQVSITAYPPTSCQYLVNFDGTYYVTNADLAAGVTIHYTYSTKVASMRSLNVLEAPNFGTGATGSTLVQSTAGQNFDCGKVGTTQWCFMKNLTSFTGTTVAAAQTDDVFLEFLTPNTVYTIAAYRRTGDWNHRQQRNPDLCCNGDGERCADAGGCCRSADEPDWHDHH